MSALIGRCYQSGQINMRCISRAWEKREVHSVPIRKLRGRILLEHFGVHEVLLYRRMVKVWGDVD